MVGKERVDPAVRALGRPAHRQLHQLTGGRLALGLALGIDLGELAGVGVGADRDPAVGLLGGPFAGGEIHSSWASEAPP